MQFRSDSTEEMRRGLDDIRASFDVPGEFPAEVVAAAEAAAAVANDESGVEVNLGEAAPAAGLDDVAELEEAADLEEAPVELEEAPLELDALEDAPVELEEATEEPDDVVDLEESEEKK